MKEDFLNLKNHLNIAAKIELQTNEKMYENRLHHLEKMLEEMRHREESFLHIAEETNILKDQVRTEETGILLFLKETKTQKPFEPRVASIVKLTLTGRLPARAVPEHDEERRQQLVCPSHDAGLPGRGFGADGHGRAATVRAPPRARRVARDLGGHLAVFPSCGQIPRSLAPGKQLKLVVAEMMRERVKNQRNIKDSTYKHTSIYIKCCAKIYTA